MPPATHIPYLLAKVDSRSFRPHLAAFHNARLLGIARPPSWWTVSHLFLLIGGLAGLSILIAAWAITLRKRIASQKATINRTSQIEETRSRLLAAINSEMPLDQLLEDICRSIDELLPGQQAFCTTDSIIEEMPGFATPPAYVLFEAILTDSKGRKTGIFGSGSSEKRELSQWETEILAIGTALANLAMNQRRIHRELNYTSTHDQLTALPNRKLGDQHLEKALQEALQTGSRVGIAYIDVDGFKQVNDQHGYKTGDLYLQQIAARLITEVRSSDKLARIDGDEFLLIAVGMHNIEEVEAYRGRLESCFDNVFSLDGITVSGSASVGAALFPDHGANAEALMRHADIDMHAAKRKRRNQRDYNPVSVADTNIFSAADLEIALQNRNFRLYYQPQFSWRGELTGFEALLRLNDPILGIVTPDAFISVAERNDLILPLGDWVLRQALSDAAKWQLDKMDGVRMVVNVAARQIEHEGFAESVIAALRDTGMPANSLEIEITERTIARDFEQAARQLARLHSEGIRISIDDFGMEHSCLSVLHKLPIDTLKIDRSFVRALQIEPRVLHIVEAIVAMGNAMVKRIVAEGVETPVDVKTLSALGKMDLQGYFFSRPQPFEEISTRLAKWRSGISV